ncbi:cell division protein SepF [Bacillus cereus]|uniref:Cell division protein SepF n=1 Tax=Bacillus arachidis TaxID=2819290 RepID=A0ABS3NVH1_9BACI|nr:MULTISPECIES: cell division protein SepF [Bacillus]PGY04225.1 cell division protein SepF [Bacillus cereus]MBO1624875.1 cell division protein SepF [Bacillus arachidis]PFE05906.1 cell division protein SepF [Bacillus sp. AFS023182]WIY59957.1 cell division protein SepF [Bacillus arachidis]SDY41952.1 cell division inhibitor SepF [Bacillus sp. 166amftsu]
MSWSKVKYFFFDTPEEREAYEKEKEQVEMKKQEPQQQDIPVTKAQPKQNIVSIETAKQSSKVVLLEPRTYSEAQGIADHLKGRRAVVINLQRMSTDQAVRIVDFLSGTVYAIGGDIQKLGPKTFICTPETVDIVGAISELFGEEEETNIKRW